MTPPIFSVIDGIQREVTSIPVVIDGVQRELDSMTAMIDGVAREIFSAVKYAWERYAVIREFVAESTVSQVGGLYSMSTNVPTIVTVYASNSPDSKTSTKYAQSLTEGEYFLHPTNGNVYKCRNYSPANNGAYAYLCTIEERMGDYIDTVSSKDSSAYPDNGEQDGYWYVKI